MSKKRKRSDVISPSEDSEVYVVKFNPFTAIRQKFEEAKKKDIAILVENMDFVPANSVVIKINYIGDAWCMGYETKFHNGMAVKIPHTIHYADVYTKENATSKTNRPKIIFEGENPFG